MSNLITFTLIVSIFYIFRIEKINGEGQNSNSGKISSQEEIKRRLKELEQNSLSKEEIKERVILLQSLKREVAGALRKSNSVSSLLPYVVSEKFTFEDDFRNLQYIKVSPTLDLFLEISKKANTAPIVQVLEQGKDFLITPNRPDSASTWIEEKKINTGKFPVIDFNFDSNQRKWIIETIRYDRD
ncbi:hypothetical protein [Leptospira neocaledonica]|uniref:Uncharacterized protein n=1 Tax=Leptospira neocaledonica TaxID=2023192 RepID=A0A2M9ZT41_9LEPT|nr:hypothetical protein [Leptospira neocaledonica]PJZ75258.1 hypothetical protein CH365_19825 [Leptospira neocaledonica]